jgi:hypothetical protein
MKLRSHSVQGFVAGVGVFLVDISPVLLLWWAGASGSVGDLSEVQLLGVGIAYALVIGVAAGRAMTRALDLAAATTSLGRLDPWGAYALGLGVYSLAMTAMPALMYGLLLTDENQTLRSRMWLVGLLWVAGRLLAVFIAWKASKALLGPELRPSGAE